MARWLTVLVIAALVATSPAGALASDVVVQGTTDVRDAGLLDDVIVPGFQAAYPQYTLKYIAVGTGQALTNARAGQGDAVLTHAPSLEQQFVSDGFSLEPFGRAIFYSDYVILGPRSDPAGVLSAAPHNAAQAFQLIAAAGDAGTANFVSRGDNSGTNVEEKTIWGLTNVARNNAGEPGSGSSNAPWYHKAGLGQADTVKLTDQCPFNGGGCYEISDRGTFNRLVANNAISQLQVVSDKNDASAPGGIFLLVNSFHAYAVNPSKVSSVNVQGALAFLDYLTSPALQDRLSTYPNAANPAFFADAHPAIALSSRRPPQRVIAGSPLRVSGRLANLLPGSAPLGGALIQLQRASARTNFTPLQGHRSSPQGRFSFAVRAVRSGLLRVSFPRFRDLSPATLDLGRVTVRAKVRLRSARVTGRRVVLTGSALPDRARSNALLSVQARPAGARPFTILRRKRLRNGSARYALTIRLRHSGTWQLRVAYRDPGAVLSAASRAVRVTAG